MKKVSILEIACNVEGNSDGIGKHARIMERELRRDDRVERVDLIAGNTVGFSKKQYVFSKEMQNTLKLAEEKVSSIHYDYAIMEYPLSEYNPMLTFSYKSFHEICQKNGTKLVLSLHEYDRVNVLRKKMLEFLMKNSDEVFVSEEKYVTKLSKFNKIIHVRTISNQLPVFTGEKAIDTSRFVYFGLINRSKAFEEMLEAWNAFNENDLFRLDILTASDYEIDESKCHEVYVHRNLDDEESAELIKQAAFGIVPVIPYIGFNNSTFVSCAQYGCTIIGKFEKETFTGCDFTIDIPTYEMTDFINGLLLTRNLTEDQLKRNSDEARRFVSRFSATAMIDQILTQI